MKRYNIDNILKKGSLINLIYGERTNGKSYQAKHKLMIEHFLKTGEKFILLRRWKDDITNNKIQEYFSDIDVMKVTNNEYDCITVYQRHIYFGKTLQNFRIERGEHIGYVMVLSQEQAYAGVSILDVKHIVYEEFFSRTTYLAKEANKIMSLYNTIDRKRNCVQLWLIGNTISRTNPVLKEWKLFDYIIKQKQGSIITIDKTLRGIDYTISLEYCENTARTGIVLGDNEEMINTGAWETTPEPHLDCSHLTYKLIFRMVFEFRKFYFIGELRSKKNELVWFIYPKYTEIKKNTFVITDVPSSSFLRQGDIYNIKKFDNLNRMMKETFIESKIFYSSDLCGNEFKSVINFIIHR